MSDGIGYTPPEPEDPNAPIKYVDVWNAGARCTFEPPREKGVRIVKRMHHDKFARRILRRAAWRNGSRIARKLDKLNVVVAACRHNTDNGHEARRLLAAELADHAAKRKAEHGPYPVNPPRAEIRAASWPHGRGARKRRNAAIVKARVQP